MPATTGTRDPRTIITPDAFEVSPALLGLPLAPPRRRLAALLIDFAVIGVITLMTKSFGFVLGVVAAVFFMRAGFKRTPVKGSVFGRAMRMSVGCFGLSIGVVTASIWLTVGGSLRTDSDDLPSSGVFDGPEPDTEVSPRELVALAAARFNLNSADNAEEAEEAIRALATTSLALGVSPSDLREQLRDQVPEGAAWADLAPAMIDAAVDDALRGPAAEVEDPDLTAAAEEVAGLSIGEVLRQYAALVTADSEDVRRAALRQRLTAEVAGDSLSTQARRIGDLEADAARQSRELASVREDLAQATEGGLLRWVRDFVDELGFGFGWASLYLTVMLSWWKGQTVGKKIMRIRVVRLDGEAITWWTAFERAGGYAAGLATGLLGFAQVYWDANRQTIHDHIVGTVVVMDGAERVGNWEEAL
jgi:uncharacterized RDD family membrane protein YckC